MVEVIIKKVFDIYGNALSQPQLLAMDKHEGPSHGDEDKAPSTDRVLTDIAHYVYHYEIKSILAFERARLALLDALACAMETISSDERPSIIGPIVKNCITSHGFRLPGTAFELDPVKGAFDMAVLIRYLDHNDAFTGAEWGHPSGVYYIRSRFFTANLRQTTLVRFLQLQTGSAETL